MASQSHQTVSGTSLSNASGPHELGNGSASAPNPEPSAAISTAGWLGSRSSIMVLVSIILIFGATTIMYFAHKNDHTALVWQILQPIADAMLVVSVTVLLTELGPFRSYVEERLQALKQLVDRPVFERLTDSAYLRDNLSPGLILRLWRASTCASLPAQIKNYPEFLHVIEDCIIPLAAETIWRKDVRLYLKHSIDGRDHQTVLRQKSRFSAVYFNTGNGERVVNIPLVHTYSKLPGFSDDQLLCNGWARTKTDGQETETDIPLSFRPTDLGDSVKFEASFSVPIGRSPVLVSIGYDAIVGPNETHRQSFSVPTSGVSVTYDHLLKYGRNCSASTWEESLE